MIQLTEELKAKAIYLGDGAYFAQLSDWQTAVFTTNGITVENEVFLEKDEAQRLIIELQKFVGTLSKS
jgi:hypothetical protein